MKHNAFGMKHNACGNNRNSPWNRISSSSNSSSSSRRLGSASSSGKSPSFRSNDAKNNDLRNNGSSQAEKELTSGRASVTDPDSMEGDTLASMQSFLMHSGGSFSSYQDLEEIMLMEAIRMSLLDSQNSVTPSDVAPEAKSAISQSISASVIKTASEIPPAQIQSTNLSISLSPALESSSLEFGPTLLSSTGYMNEGTFAGRTALTLMDEINEALIPIPDTCQNTTSNNDTYLHPSSPP